VVDAWQLERHEWACGVCTLALCVQGFKFAGLLTSIPQLAAWEAEGRPLHVLLVVRDGRDLVTSGGDHSVLHALGQQLGISTATAQGELRAWSEANMKVRSGAGAPVELGSTWLMDTDVRVP